MAATSSDVIRDYEIFGPSRLRNRERERESDGLFNIHAH